MANLEVVNVGALPNDGEGDPLRVAFQKINNNFANLWLTSFQTSNTYSIGNTAGQVIFTTPVSQFTQGMFQIRSSNPDNNDSQDIVLQAQITNTKDSIKFTGYGTSFSGNSVTSYDMDIVGSNVRIIVNPLVDQILLHFISSQITFIGVDAPGLDLALDGYADGFVMSTEDNLNITTED